MREVGKIAIATSLLFGLAGMITGVSAVCVCANKFGEPSSEAFKQAKAYVEAEATTINAKGYSFKVRYDYQNTIAEQDDFGYYTFLEKKYTETTWLNYSVVKVMSYKGSSAWQVSINE